VQLVLLIIVVAVAAGLAAGGNLRRFEHVTLRWWGLAIAGLTLQIVPLPHQAGRLVVGTTLGASYAMLVAFVWMNRRLPAAPLILAGLALNLLVVVPNAGMPVSAHAADLAGGTTSEIPLAGTGPDKHHLMTPHDVLRPLGDVIPGPPPLGVVLSIGDVLLYAGVAAFVVMVMRGRLDADRPKARRRVRGYQGKHLAQGEHLPR
jgi:hypothetical protein